MSNFKIEYQIPPTRGIHYLQALNVRDEQHARELFVEEVPRGKIRKVEPLGNETVVKK